MSVDHRCLFIVSNNTSVVRHWVSIADSLGIPTTHRLPRGGDPHRVGCVVVDSECSTSIGLQAILDVRAVGCPLPVIVVSRDPDVALAVQAMQAGAFDLLAAPHAESVLVSAIYGAVAHSERIHQSWLEQQKSRALLATLSCRQREVVNLLADGKTTREAANALGVQPKTIDFHRTIAFQKLGVENAVALTTLLVRSAKSDGAES